jgi:fructokinase
MAGFLDGRITLGLDLAGSLRRGAAAASIVCSRQGAQPPTSAEVDELLGGATA